MSDTDYVKWFRHSAPYINAHRGKTFVLMFGGEAVAHPNFDNIVHDIALLNSLGVKLVLVHGARPQIEQRARERGIASQFHRGLRVTDPATLGCVTDAAGSLRAHIEALLSMGVANSPMHGAAIRVCSGNFVIAKPIGVVDGVDYGHSGEVRRIDSSAIHALLAQHHVVLLSPLGYSPTGEVFNLALEDIAAQTAVALGADKLIAFGEEAGLLDGDGELIRQCDTSTLRAELEQTEDGDRARILQALLQAAQGGVSRCHLLGHGDDGALLQELFSRDGAGTLIAQDHYEQLVTASIDDVGGILEIIAPLEAEGALVKRSRELLETEIGHFKLIKRDGMVIACAALYPYAEAGCGEIACVATHPDYRRGDRGERLLQALEQEARSRGLGSVFVLTTRTAHWFREQGFVPAGVDALPTQKQQLYNFQRNSKVFVKTL